MFAKKTRLKVLIACEESQVFTKIFRELGHEAYSCDIKNCSGGRPLWHIKANALEVAYDQPWDLMIAHPPCTFLSGAQRGWLSHRDDSHKPFFERRDHPKFVNRRENSLEALEFVNALSNSPIEHIAIENPCGLLNQEIWRDLLCGYWPQFMLERPQTLQPFQFGDEIQKRSCFWLKNLKPISTIIDKKDYQKGEMITLKNGKKIPKWFNKSFKTAEERRTHRSKNLYPKMSKALATQFINSITQ